MPVRRLLGGLCLCAVLAAPAVIDARSLPDGARGRTKSIKLYELVRLGDMLVASGQLQRAIEFYNDFRFNFATDAVYWRRFSQLYEKDGDLERALACLEHLPRLEGTELGDVVRQGELLWRLRRPDSALARLVGSKEQATAEDTAYWKLLHELAWNQEQDVLALEALRRLWGVDRDPVISRDLFYLVRKLGNYDEAAEVALAGLRGLRNPDLLIEGVRFAVEGRRLAAARQMVELAERRVGYDRYPEFFQARALVAAGEGRRHDADRDFARAVGIDPGAGACPEWLAASASLQSRAMAHHALEACAAREERRPSSWDLLADAYRIIDRPLDATRFREMARQRGAWAEPREFRRDVPAAEMALQEAVDRNDRAVVAQLLTSAAAVLGPVARLQALETLGRNAEAWALLESGGYTARDRKPSNPDEAFLLERGEALQEEHLSGAWVTGRATSIGALALFEAGARAEQRWRELYFGLDVSETRLVLSEPELLRGGRDEIAVAATLRRRFGAHATRVRAGVRVVPWGWLSQAELAHAATLLDDKLQVDAQAFVARLPSLTSTLRMHALLDGGMVAASYLLPFAFELRGVAEGGRLAARDRALIGWEAAVTAEVGRRMLLPFTTVRPRVFAMHNLRTHERYLPSSLLPALRAGADLDGFWLDGYTSLGAGLAIGNGMGRDIDGKGPYVAVRYELQAAGTATWPTLTPAFGVEGMLSVVFARRQEIGAEGFFYSGIDRRIGERYAGGSLTYTARWF